jgi:hypothetical protein
MAEAGGACLPTSRNAEVVKGMFGHASDESSGAADAAAPL